MIREFGATAVIMFAAIGVSAQKVDDSTARSGDRSHKASHTVDKTRSRVITLGPSTTYLEKGLSEEEVVTFLGEPASKAQAWRGGRSLMTYSYDRGYGHVLRIEFTEGLLSAYRNETKTADAK